MKHIKLMQIILDIINVSTQFTMSSISPLWGLNQQKMSILNSNVSALAGKSYSQNFTHEWIWFLSVAAMLSLPHSPGRRHHEAGRGDPPPLRRVCQPPEDERDQGRPIGVFNVGRGLSRGIRIRGLYRNQQRGQVWRVTWVQSFLLKFIGESKENM